MREKYYVITAYLIDYGDRVVCAESDYLLPALYYWFKIKFDKSWKYPVMKVST